MRGEQRRRNENRDLFLCEHGFERGANRDFRFAVADVAAHEPIHRPRGRHVAFDFDDRFELIGRLRIRKGFFELGLPRRIGTERIARRRFTLGVERDEVVGDLCELLADAALGARPVGAAHA